MTRIFGPQGRVGIVVPANNATLEPELWPQLPLGVAVYCTKILAKGDLTPEAVHAMDAHFDRAVEEVCATGVDVIVYADMVTTFIMPANWNVERTTAVTARTGLVCISAWIALESALKALGVSRFALGTPYPRAVHDLTLPFFTSLGYQVTSHATLDIVAMSDVPNVTGQELHGLVKRLDLERAEAVVLLATDLPTFAEIEALERAAGIPVLTSNQAILWSALRQCGNPAKLARLGRLLEFA